MEFSNKGHDGSLFGRFYVKRSPSTGPGWFIFGRNVHKYGVHDSIESGALYGEGRYISLCGQVRRGRARGYNGDVRIGWGNRALALQALAEILRSNPNMNEDGQ